MHLMALHCSAQAFIPSTIISLGNKKALEPSAIAGGALLLMHEVPQPAAKDAVQEASALASRARHQGNKHWERCLG